MAGIKLSAAITVAALTASLTTSVLTSDIRATQSSSSTPTGTSEHTTGTQLPAAPNQLAAAALHYAHSQLGKPYQWGASGPDAFDCSGLVMRAWKAAGVTLPRVSRDQARAGQQIPLTKAQPGDLLFWSGNGETSGVYHVALYLGAGRILEASRPGRPVAIRRVSWSEKDLLGYAVRPTSPGPRSGTARTGRG